MPKLTGIEDRKDVPFYDGTPILAARLKSPRLRKNKQGVPDLDAAFSNNMRGGYNGNRTVCGHATPGVIPTYAVDERRLIDGMVRAVRTTYCTNCSAILWDDLES